MALERFQEATVEAAVAALTRSDGSRRFLIADEVGLGKTVSAKAIAAELRTRRRGPLNVVYLCPNLDIASQNLTKLRSLAPEWPHPEDRLSLVLRDKPVRMATTFRIYSYTPDTSLPGWKSGLRTGRTAERELIASLLHSSTPLLWKRVRALERRREATQLHRWFPSDPPPAPAHLARPFEAALRKVADLVGRPLDDGLVAKLAFWKEDVAELILRCRAALALAALKHAACRPDLLILDEFHRYADLILPAGAPPGDPLGAERHRVQRMLVEALIGDGEDGPALLLLSATPYRLRRLDKSEIPGGRYDHFLKLVRFLVGTGGSDQADAAEKAIVAHHVALSRRDDAASALTDVAIAKADLERLLRPVIARTERATAISGELFERYDNQARVEPADLVTFRHLARAVDRKRGALRSWVQPLWSSVPYPAETLFNYKICNALGADLPPVTIATGRDRPAHPQLRALVDPDGQTASTLSGDALALPWLAPTRTWWQLGGRWKHLHDADRLRGKALLFSRYRGTPAAVATWLSGEVERRAGGRTGRRARKDKAQAYLRPDMKNPWPLISLFMPWPKLSTAFDPVRAPDRRLVDVRKHARRELRGWLVEQGFEVIDHGGPSRRPWRLALEVEALLGDPALVTSALWELKGLVRPRAWRPARASRSISLREIESLADWMLGAPGPVVARTVLRHAPELLAHVAATATVFRFCWRQLRPYLGQRHFAGVVLGGSRRKVPGGYPEALRQAVLDGGLEATLDEHVATMRLIGDDPLATILQRSIVGRPGRVQRRTTRGVRAAPVHAAAPYLGAERKGEGSKGSEKLRSDTLRAGFNSPFWPHVLATTSIGQEGLDFHVWCDRVLHWDLPRDPVDFEQREGRIARYASLGVRRALARTHGGGDLPSWRSPFSAIFEAARNAGRQGLGLERWWSPTGYRPISVTFSLPFSLGGLRLARLRDDLVRYRLALGQPEPKLFEAMIEHFGLDQEQARGLALNLSPATVPPALEAATDRSASTSAVLAA